MPLDSFTLEWFKRVKSQKGISTLKTDKYVDGKKPSWSALTNDGSKDNSHYRKWRQNEKDPEQQEYTYEFFRDEIGHLFGQNRIVFDQNKDYGNVGEYKNYTPLQAEFLIWPDIQLEMATEAFIAALKEPDGANVDKTEPLKDKIKRAREKIDNYLSRNP